MKALRRGMKILWIFLVFLKEVVKANLQVASLILKDPESIRPALLKIPLEISSERGIFFLSSMITLTPGTLSLEVSRDRRFLYVHVIHAEDPEAVIREIKAGFEKSLLEVRC